MPILVVCTRSSPITFASLLLIHNESLSIILRELNETSMPNVFVTRPGPEANLSFSSEIKTALIKTPLAKFFLSVTTFKQW